MLSVTSKAFNRTLYVFLHINVILQHVSYTFNTQQVTARMTLGCRNVSLVIPDNFTVFTGDMKLEHIPTLHVFYELKRNLQSKEREHQLYTQSHFDGNVNQLIENIKTVPTEHMQSVKVVWQTATDHRFSKCVVNTVKRLHAKNQSQLQQHHV